ncbi:hypothetical protein ACFYW6_17890 [Streptomyces sp. NPDC002659]|uniref:hypothetical protein n=1 Tax=Streptomyces sp. NPDC002659 TaxID=3364656 RepID=UPI00369EE0F5
MVAGEGLMRAAGGNSSTIFTLGPAGTDAHHIAKGLGDVTLVDSFPTAMRLAWESSEFALVCPGFVERAESGITDSWVSLHFRYFGRMRILKAWTAPTKPMCIAVNMHLASGLGDVESVALHPSTSAFAERYVPSAKHVYVGAKPLAVAEAEKGNAAACIGSIDIVDSAKNLKIEEVFYPEMLWCLYQRDAVDQEGFPEPRAGACNAVEQ